MLLASCDRRTLVGRRDFAVLLLLSRLGLRAGEVAAVRLDDIEWRAGLLLVRGEGSRQDVLPLPLPVDVGEAIVSCLRRRPRCEYRALFLRVMASREGLNRCTVAWVVRAACDREPPRQPGATGTVAPSGMPANSPVSDPVVVISVYVSLGEKIGQEAGGNELQAGVAQVDRARGVDLGRTRHLR